MIFLCQIADLAATGAKGVVLGKGKDTLDIVIVEKAGRHYAYINACPHQFIPLETFPDYFFSEDREHLICSGHWALFKAETGLCVEGPCNGEKLEALRIAEKDGALYLDEPRAPKEIARAKKEAMRNW